MDKSSSNSAAQSNLSSQRANNGEVKDIGRYNMIGMSPAMQRVYDSISLYARSSAPVCIVGPSGVGKELVARALHSYSDRKRGPYVAINAGSYRGSSDILESLLYGIEKGVATQVSQRQGVFQQADGGTLFLDEVAEIDPVVQVRLLRVLQDNAVSPLGSNLRHSATFNIRLLTGSPSPLSCAMHDGKIRRDFYYRIAVVSFRVPSLSERLEDIPLLANHFLKKYSEREGLAPVPALTESAQKYLQSLPWPGNVRQLENFIWRVLATYRDVPILNSEHMFFSEMNNNPSIASPDIVDDSYMPNLEDIRQMQTDLLKVKLEKVIAHFKGNLMRSGRHLGIDRSNLRKMLRDLGIKPEDYRSK